MTQRQYKATWYFENLNNFSISAIQEAKYRDTKDIDIFLLSSKPKIMMITSQKNALAQKGPKSLMHNLDLQTAEKMQEIKVGDL